MALSGSHGGSPSPDVCDVPAPSLSGPASALGSDGGSPSPDVCDVAAPSVITTVNDSSPSLITWDEASGTPAEQVKPAQVLASLAAGVRLFRSNDGRFFAQVPVGDRLEVFCLKSAGFRDWLIHGYLIYQPEPPSQVAIRRAIGMLEARARFDDDIPEVFIRTGRDGDGSAYFLDLGDASGRAIAIRDRGWIAVDRPDVHFRRPGGHGGWEPGTFLSTYTDNRKEATLTDLLDSPLGNALLQVASLIPEVSETPGKLHAKLTHIVGKKVAASADWPKTPGNFGNALRRLAPRLRLHGVSISFERRHEGRMIILKSERVPIAPAGDARAKTESS
jgi:hypothetical protein